MDKQKNTLGKASVPKRTSEQATKKEERTFSVSTLRDNCVKLFRCTTSTFDGAFFGCADKEYSVKEANAIIKKWLGKEIEE